MKAEGRNYARVKFFKDKFFYIIPKNPKNFKTHGKKIPSPLYFLRRIFYNKQKIIFFLKE